MAARHTRTRFDAQAGGFDRRTGVGPAAPDIAAAVVEAAGLGRGDPLLEIGPGTGEIGFHLAARTRRYAGLDLSRPMLEEFAARRPDCALLVLADAARAWPIRSGSVAASFASRAAHLLDVDHVAAELTRVSAPGAPFLVGRVERERSGLRSRLRARRRALLAERGIAPAEGRDRSVLLLHRLVEAGAVPVEVRVAVSWTVRTDVAAVLASWERTASIGGDALPDDVAAAVAAELRAWAAAQLPESADETETYLLEGARLP